MTTFTKISELPISTSRPSDIVLDAVNLMRVVGQILSQGDISDEYADELSWLLGSCKKRLEPLAELLETFEGAGAISIIPEAYRADLAIMVDIEASRTKLDKIRKEVKA